MSVSYVYGPTTAHVAKYQGKRPGAEVASWVSICGHRVERLCVADPHPGLQGGIHHTTYEGLPLVPWCSWCTAQVRELAEIVLGLGVGDD